MVGTAILCAYALTSRRRGVVHVATLLLRALPPALAVVLSASLVAAAEHEAGAPPTSLPTAPIPTAEVAARAAEVSSLLRTVKEEPAIGAEVEAIRKWLPAFREQISLDVAALTVILGEHPTLRMLQANEEVWQQRRLQATTWLNLLTRRATLLQATLNHLTDLGRTWRRTRESLKEVGAPGPLHEQVDAVLADVDEARAPLEAQRTTLLDVQSAVAREVARCETALAQLSQAQQTAMVGLLVRGSPPIWSSELRARAAATMRARVHEVVASRAADIGTYLRDPSKGMPLHVGLFALLALILCAARRRAHEWTEIADGASPATAVFDRPYAAALAVTLLFAAAPGSTVPRNVRSMLAVLVLAPVIRLIRPAVDRRLAGVLYALGILFAVDSVRTTFGAVPMLEHIILVVEMLAGIGTVAYLLSFGGLRRPSPEEPGTERLGVGRTIAGAVAVVFTVALLAGSAGYMSLARLLASAVLGSGALALELYAGIQVLIGLTAFALRTWPLARFQMVEHHRHLLERRIRGVLRWAAAGVWVVRSLDNVGIYQPARSLGAAVLETNLGRGAIQISVGNLLEFVLTLWLAYLVSTFVRFVLSEEVYPRTQLTRGLSYAISSLLNYVIIALGFILALGILGLDLTRLTVLAGAFGVGLGFGLQSVVNNFVSGLILLFERPIHVGDAVEVGDVSGEVSRIGIRASTVRTWQGAEIIVPNAQLVTERVTNWTRSDRTRRIDLAVGVDYKSDPEKVVELLEAAARAHPEIMKNPAPRAVFTAFGDSAILFELRAWTNRFERWAIVRTDLAVTVYAELQAAGMTIPLPQREVRVLPDAIGPAGGDGAR
jgi:potassium-dependent mechanosensitive channel